MNRHTVAALIVLVIGLITARSARAQVIPSPPWGEPIQDPSRFVVLASFNNEAVYDQETGLVWEQSPSTTRQTWADALVSCNQKIAGNRKGWRLATLQELASLVDPSMAVQGDPTVLMLPAGHPFSNIQSSSFVYYWSGTNSALFPGTAWVVLFASFSFGDDVNTADKTSVFRAWCVRGGQGVNPQ
jgi:hypothetical protein